MVKIEEPLHIYFDMDDTLCRTTDYQRLQIETLLIKENRIEDLEEFRFLCMTNKPKHKYPEKFSSLFRQILEDKKFMSEVKPSVLFHYFFLIPGNQPNNTTFNILTHRGEDEETLIRTKGWVYKYNPIPTIRKFHCISHEKHPNKLDYLFNLYPEGNFILVDDNPLFDIEKVYPKYPQLRIFNMYSDYSKAYQNQKYVSFENGIFNLHIQ